MIFSKRCAIIGNAGSGKSTFAKKIQAETKMPILDLDNITWERGERIQKRLNIDDSLRMLSDFVSKESDGWIIEGCYGELIKNTLQYSPTLIFLDPGEKICIENCKYRKWEPHKYTSKEDQDKLLPFLVSWVSEYYRRDGYMSHKFHQDLFDSYEGLKHCVS